MGPVVQSTAEIEDPLEIRIYGGRDADFLLYEDSGDGYAYEKGERAVIPLHWDNRQGTLSIGARAGAFSGMPTWHHFRIVLVRAGHGVGNRWESKPDRLVTYDGHRMNIHLHKPNFAGANGN